MTEYYLGIDTGGTYTDAVLLDKENGEVIRQVKKLTTHHDLSIGVGQALAAMFDTDIKPDKVVRMAVSTTLATNAVVEGRGARVGLFVMGYVKQFKLPVVANMFLKGGHNVLGEEEEPLDLEELVDTVQDLQKEVDAYAVCSAMSIQNPTHELVAEKAIKMLDPKPIFCSHRVSVHPGMRERAATACLHAKLQPIMEIFLGSVNKSMAAVGLQCPVIIICGDGKAISLQEATQRAALTMASGPAATATFGANVEKQNALVVDVGGTTTDICLIKDGVAAMSTEGCRIGPWLTHVEAVDMYTGAAGGDSHIIRRQNGAVEMGAVRVQPLAMTPDLPDPRDWIGEERQAAIIMPVRREENADLEKDEVLKCLAANGPVTPDTLARKTGISGVTLEKHLERLIYQQKIVMAGFTPTDALHALNQLQLGNAEHSLAAAEILAKHAAMSTNDFCRKVLALTEERIENLIIDYLARAMWGESYTASLLDKRDNELFSLSCALKVRIIGVGAAAKFFLPGVAERLRTDILFPDHFEVGNAMGAALIAMEG